MAAFIAVEEECLILENWPPKCPTKSVAHQGRTGKGRGIPIRVHGVIAEPVVGLENRSTIELESSSVPIVGSRFRLQIDLRSARTALVGIAIRCRHAELLDRLRVQPQNRPSCDVISVGSQLADNQ